MNRTTSKALILASAIGTLLCVGITTQQQTPPHIDVIVPREVHPKPCGRPLPPKGDPVNPNNGAFMLRETVISWASRGMDFAFTVHYDSTAAGSPIWGDFMESAMGAAATFNFNHYICVYPRMVQPAPYGGPSDGPSAPQETGTTHHSGGGGTATISGGPGGGTTIYGHYDAYYSPGENRIDRFAAVGNLLESVGYFSKLRPIYGAGSSWIPESYELRNPDGTILTFGVKNAFNPWVRGGAITFHVTKMEDRKGNAMRFLYENHSIPQGSYRRLRWIVDTLGRALEVHYGPSQRIDWIRDFSGRKVHFTHDTHGNLTSITRPAVMGTSTGNDFPLGKTETYDYGSAPARHHIERLFDSNSTVPYAQNAYDGMNRVARQIFGGERTVNGTNYRSGGEYRFLYEQSLPGSSSGLHRSRVLTVDPNGNVELACFNDRGFPVLDMRFSGRLNPEMLPSDAVIMGMPSTPPPSWVGPIVVGSSDSPEGCFLNPAYPGYQPPLRAEDPPCTFTRTSFDPEGRVLEIVGEGVHRRFHHYQGSDRFQMGNAILVESMPHPANGERTIVTATAFEPLFNQVCATVDPRGFDPDPDFSHFPPNETGGSPDQYTSRIFFDYQEMPFAPGPGSLWFDEAMRWSIDLAQIAQRDYLASWNWHVPSIFHDAGLGDLNDDGRTDQARGNAIRTEAPSVQVYANPAEPDSSFVEQRIVSKTQYNDFSLVKATIDPMGNKTITRYFAENCPTGSGPVTPPAPFRGGPSVTLSGIAGEDGGGFVMQVAMPEGVSHRFHRDSLGRVIRSTDGRGFVATTEYNQLDQVVRTVNAKGHWVENYYDESDFLVRTKASYFTHESFPHGELGPQVELAPVVTDFFYDLLGHNVETRTQAVYQGESQEIVTRHRFDKLGNLVLSMSPEWDADRQNVTATIFDEKNRAFEVTVGGISERFRNLPANAWIEELAQISSDPQTMTATRQDYDAAGNPTRFVDAEGFITRTEYDGFNRPVRAFDAEGNFSQTRYGASGLVNESFAYEASDPTVPVAHGLTRYDRAGRACETKMDVIPAGSIELVPGSLSQNTDFVLSRVLYDANGRAIQTVNNNGISSFSAYDGLNRMTNAWDALGNATNYLYDRNGNLIQNAILEKSDLPPLHADQTRVFRNYYDELNRLVATVDHLFQAGRTAHDSFGRIVWTSDARGNGQTVSLASLDRWNEHPDSAGFAVNAFGNTSSMSYDSMGRLRESSSYMRTAGLGGNGLLPGENGRIVHRQSYDRNSRLLTQSDDKGNTTSYVYDSRNNIRETHFADGTVESMTVTARDLPWAIAKPNGYSIVHAYTAKGQLWTKAISRSSAPVFGADSEIFEYDGLGRMKTAENRKAGALVSRVVMNYNSLSQMQSETLSVGGQTETTTMGYDGIGNLRRLVYPNASSPRAIRQSYDALGRLSQIGEWSGETIADYSYLGGRVIRRGYFHESSGAKTSEMTVQYDDLGRPVETRFVKVAGETVRDRRQYQWDAANNKTRRLDLVAGREWAYQYDSAEQLTRSDFTSASGSMTTNNYTLDQVGNRTRVNSEFYSMSAAPELADAPMNQYTQTPFDSRQYDWCGNLTEIFGRAAMDYDYRNFMTAYHDVALGKTHEFVYDALGRRIRKIENSGAAPRTTTYFYSLGHVLRAQAVGPAGLDVNFVYGRGADTVLQVRVGMTDEYGYRVTDEMGNFHKLLDKDGDSFGGTSYPSIEYGDFGEILHAGTMAPLNLTGANNLAFLRLVRFVAGSKEFDPETGWSFYRTRYLDPKAGRFTTRDPLGIWGDAVNLGNGYSFCGNNFWSKMDPSGMKCFKGTPTYEEQQAERVKRMAEIEDQVEAQNADTIGNRGDTGSSKDADFGQKISEQNAATKGNRGDVSHHGSAKTVSEQKAEAVIAAAKDTRYCKVSPATDPTQKRSVHKLQKFEDENGQVVGYGVVDVESGKVIEWIGDGVERVKYPQESPATVPKKDSVPSVCAIKPGDAERAIRFAEKDIELYGPDSPQGRAATEVLDGYGGKPPKQGPSNPWYDLEDGFQMTEKNKEFSNTGYSKPFRGADPSKSYEKQPFGGHRSLQGSQIRPPTRVIAR